MRISDWSSDGCSSDLVSSRPLGLAAPLGPTRKGPPPHRLRTAAHHVERGALSGCLLDLPAPGHGGAGSHHGLRERRFPEPRSEEHTSELQSLMRISYAVFCLKKKNENQSHKYKNITSINI